MARRKATPEDIRRREIKKRRAELSAIAKEKGICAVCDNGGSVTFCDGGCQRSFHLDLDDSEGSECILQLGLTKEQGKMLATMEEDFICPNCKYKKHQCFVCRELGSSDTTSSRPQVFQCGHDDCGHFYHPNCVAQLLYPDSELEATLFEDHVYGREKFLCPMHECAVCKGGEKKHDKDMQFAVCRRCPTAYHKKCLPSTIAFESAIGRNGSMQRAWDGILSDQILIYCMKHKIRRSLGTPNRDHITFRGADEVSLPETLEGAPMGQDKPEETEVLDRPFPEQPQPPPPSASVPNRCCCSNPLDSFAPSSLFMHPYPGSCGWLDD